jgi:hypothetical protein
MLAVFPVRESSKQTSTPSPEALRSVTLMPVRYTASPSPFLEDGGSGNGFEAIPSKLALSKRYRTPQLVNSNFSGRVTDFSRSFG